MVHSEASFASVAYLRIDKASLAPYETDDSYRRKLIDDLAVPLHDSKSQKLLARLSSTPDLAELSLNGDGAGAPSPAVPQAPPSIHPAFARNGPWFAVSNVRPEHSSTSSSKARDLHPPAFRDAKIRSLKHGQGEAAELTIELDTYESAFQRLFTLLHEHGLHPRQIVHVNFYLASQDDFLHANTKYKQFFGSSPPSRACIALGERLGCKVGIEVIGFVDPSGPSGAAHRRALHVQSRSYWAPANIGPYSQAVVAGGRITIAGQIGLRPSDLSLPDSFEEQAVLSLQHARRILRAVLEQSANAKKHWVEGGVCWLEAPEGGSSAVAARRRLAGLAAQVWHGDDHADEGDADSDDDDGDGSAQKSEAYFEETRWHAQWKGPSMRQADYERIPLVFAFLPTGALPRRAKIEWQLTAQTGTGEAQGDRPEESNDVKSDGEDSDDDGDGSESAGALPQLGESSALLK